MISRKPSRPLLLASILLLAVMTAGIWMQRTASASSYPSKGHTLTATPPSKLPREHRLQGHALTPSSRLENEVAALDVSEVRARLFGTRYEPGELAQHVQREETKFLLQRLGELMGEAGVDEVVSEWGHLGNRLGDAIAPALAGWSWADPVAASAAFQSALDPPHTNLKLNLFSVAGSSLQWKGRPIISGLG